jgi:hypothetical protein
MILPGLFAGYLTLFLAGFGVTLLLKRGQRRLNVLEHCCLAWLFGTGVVSLLLWLCGSFVSGAILQAVVVVACVTLGLLGWKAKQRGAAKFYFPRPASAVEWLIASLIAIEIATFFFVSFKHTLGWDGLLNWEIKARYAFMNGGVIPPEYYSSSARAFSHPEYPLGIPFTELWLYMWMGQPNQFWVKAIFPTFYATGSILLALLGARITGRRWSGLLVAVLLPFVPLLTAGPGGVIVAYPDFPFAVIYMAALGYLLYSLGKTDHSLSIYAGCMTLLPWFKREGLVLWVVLAALGLVVNIPRTKWRSFVFLIPGAVLVMSWHFYLMLRHTVPQSDFMRLSLRTLYENKDRILPILRASVSEAGQLGNWRIFWHV